jgi:hypothetical protein
VILQPPRGSFSAAHTSFDKTARVDRAPAMGIRTNIGYGKPIPSAENWTTRYAPAISRRDAPELCKSLLPLITEGAGNAGCPLHPQPRVQSVESTRVSHHRFTGTPGISCAVVLTAYFVLSPVTGLVCHRRLRMIGASNPVGPTSPPPT